MIRLGLAPPQLALLSLDLHCAMQLLPIAIQPLGSSPARSLPKQAFNGLRQQTVCTEIPIASNAPPCHTSRGFLPWRFAYAGPRVRRTTFTGPASANLHRRRQLYCCNALHRRCEGPWSFSWETMRTLTSRYTKRISSPRKFRSSPPKDFCNNIRSRADVAGRRS